MFIGKSQKLFSLVLVASITLLSSVAFADVEALSIRFGGGCFESNTSGSCVIKVTATGSDLDSETVRLTSGATRTDRFTKVSSRLRSLENGSAKFRFKNIPGACFRVVTGPNGNAAPDARSNIICQGEQNGSNGSTSSSTGSGGSLSSASSSSSSAASDSSSSSAGSNASSSSSDSSDDSSDSSDD